MVVWFGVCSRNLVISPSSCSRSARPPIEDPGVDGAGGSEVVDAAVGDVLYAITESHLICREICQVAASVSVDEH